MCAWSGSTFTRTNGTYSGATVWEQDYNAGQKVNPIRQDTHDQDLATGINACLNKNGQNSATANLNLGGYRYTNAGVATSRTDLARADQLQDDALCWGGTSTGSSGSYAITLTPAPSAYTAGMRIAFLTNHTASSAGATVNVNGLGAKTLVSYDVAGVPGNSILTNNIVEARYDGTYFRIISPVVETLIGWAGTTAGAATGAMTATIGATSTTPAPTTYTTGMRIAFILDDTCAVAAATININGIGAKLLVGNNNTAGFPPVTFLIGMLVEARYDGTYFRVVSPLGKEPLPFTPSPVMSSGTITGITVTHADYVLDPFSRLCHINIGFFGTTGGTLTGASLRFTLPRTASLSNGYVVSNLSEGSTRYFGETLISLDTAVTRKISWAGVITDYNAALVSLYCNFTYVIS